MAEHPIRDRWTLPIVALAAILGIAAIELRPLLDPHPLLLAAPDGACDLQAGPCSGRFPQGGAVTLEIAPRPIAPLAPLDLRVATQGLDPYSVQIDFVGLEMDMGYNRPTLTAVGPGRYRGEGTLPICVRDRMAWEALSLIHI